MTFGKLAFPLSCCAALLTLACVGPAVAMPAQSAASPQPPRFADYPAQPLPAASRQATRIKLATAQARRYRTVISDEGRRSPNFAGHFRIVTWGCGTDCRGFAIVDRQTGIARTAPGIDYVTGAMGNDQARIDFRANSRLLIINGAINEADEGSYFYEWTRKTLKLLCRLPLAKEDLADAPPETP